MNKLEIVGKIFMVIGAIVNIGSQVIGEKMLDQKISKEVSKRLHK